MRKQELKPKHTVEELIKIKKESQDAGQKTRITAIIKLKRGKIIKEVVEDLNTTRRSVSTWIHRYNQSGIEGLKSNEGGRPPGDYKWEPEIFVKLTAEIIKTNGYWSIPKMQKWIKDNHKLEIPEQTVWNRLNDLGFSYKSSRPHPYKGDKIKQEDFKKKASWRVV
jgi:transposase